MRKVYLTVLISIIYLTSFGAFANEVSVKNHVVSNIESSEFGEMEDVVTCGSISAVRIYDQSTDQPVPGIDALYDGINIDASMLPSNYYIAVETYGTIESVRIWIDGNNLNTENVAPYTYPGGAETGSNWNGGAGSYDLDASAYLYDDANHQCSSVWLAFNIVGGGCDDVTDAGSIQGGFTACSGDDFTITSNELPSGGSGELEYVWLFNPNGPNLSGHTAISNSNVAELTTTNTETGWYRRCSQRVGCSGFSTGESNWVEVTISDCPCDNVTDAGSIQGGFTACSGDDFTIINTAMPTGGSGALEFVWLFNPNGPNLDNYSEIANSNSADLTVSNTESGYYRRCARRAGCSDFTGESNWVHVAIDDNCNDLTPPSILECENGFLWENNIDITTLNGGAGIPSADLRFVDYNVTQFTVPGPYPSEFGQAVIISSIEAVSWDAYLNRPNTGDQPNEQWRVIFKNNGNTVYASDYTEDLQTGTLVAETITTLGTNITLAGIDEIILAHYEDPTYGTSSSSSANSVVPVSICINYAPGCENTAPTADNLEPEITSECGEDFPTITFSDETSTATVVNYEEYPATKSCKIDFSSYPAYQNTNIWFHAFHDDYDKHFEWNEGHVITLEDNTVKLIGRIQNVNDANSGFLLEFYFEELQDQATFLANGGYNSTDADAADRLYANVDFTKPNSIIGFGSFADADLELTNTGNVHHMDIGPRNVYGGYGFGFWIDYVGTVNGVPVGNSGSTGTNHMDMYSALNVCYDNENECEDFIIREWAVEDECGNTDIFVQHVNVVDTESPVATDVEDVTVLCDEDLPTDEPSFTDACDNDLDVTFEESSEVNADGLTVITRTWTATDDCGNNTTSSYAITILACTNVGDTVWYDNDRDGIQDTDENGVEGVTVNLISPGPDGLFHTDDDAIVATQETDENGNYLFEGVVPGEYCIEFIESTIPAEYVFTASNEGGDDAIDSDVDENGKTESFTVVSGQDDDLTWDAGIYTCTEITIDGAVEDLIVECGDAIPAPVEPNFTDAVDTDLDVVYSESETSNDCESQISRTWIATNDCGNTLTVDQLVTIVDTTAPTLEGVPANGAYECLEDVPGVADVTPNDNCDEDPEVTFTESSEGEDCSTIITRVWTVTDNCNNTTEYTQLISIEDDSNPEVSNTPADITIECSEEMPSDAPDFTDNCDDDLTIVMNDEESGDGCPLVITRTWTATDDCGNEVSATQVITVNDTTAPEVANAPVDVTVECSEDIPADAPVFTDNCDEDLTVEMTEENNTLACQYELVRTWTATDDCGNVTSVSQAITVTDTTAPTLADVPANMTVACLDEVMDAPELVANDNCDDNPSVDFVESSELDGCETVITRVWTVTDACENVTEYTQMITVADNISPEVIESPADVTIECAGDMPADEASFEDNCDDELTVVMTEVESGNGCPLVITRTWTATDDCGNETATSQVITINDTTAPVASDEPADITIQCDETAPDAEPSFLDNCDEDLTIDFTEENNALDCQYELVRTWTATDDCGNATTVTQVITVTDASAPTLEGVPANASVECMDDVPAAPAVSPLDNCDTNPTVDFNESSEQNGCEIVITRMWTVTDACANVTSYTQLISVNDETAPVVENELSDVTVTCDEETPNDEPTFADNCDSDLTITFEESSAYNAEGVNVITRTWTATDDCGNATSTSQELTILPCMNIGDTVWYDVDQDGIQDADEDGVEGVTVNLVSPGPDGLFHTDDDMIVDTQETDENGNYLFEEVYPGEYCIEFVESTIPADFVFTGTDEGADDAADSDSDEEGKTEPFTVEPGQEDDLTFDAGIYNPVNIGDTVWYDVDQDGIQDADEDGVEGVTVNLVSAGPDGLFHTDDDMIVDTQETDENGNYLFEEVIPGLYCIEFVESTIPADYIFTASNEGGDDAADSDSDEEGKTEPFEVVANQDDDLTFDAGIFDPVNIGDTVFNDLDQDGIQDADEPGVEGVTVNLVSAGPDGLFHTDDDVIVDTQETDENGNYLFEEVVPGLYCIEFVESTIPSGTSFTASNEGGDDAADSDADAEGKTEPFEVTAGQDDDLTFDAGIFDPVNIGDTVWYDVDQDGIQDADEDGVEGVTVNLVSAGPDGLYHTDDDVVVDTQMTDENGNYLFEEVAPGNYCIEFVESTIPAEYIFTASNEGADDSADSDADAEGKTEAFDVMAGQDDDLSFDAGIYNSVNIGDTVFNDLNQDGIQDADEPGVEGVTVNLVSPGPDGLFHTDDDMIVDTQETDENGNYLFEDVIPGAYCIEFVESTLPAGTEFTASNQGADDAADSDADAEGKTEPFEVVAGQDDDLTFDAGIFDPINIGDTVFNDLNQDGIQDADEPGVPGVTVNLIGPGPDGLFHTDDDVIVDSQETDENGNYLFEDVVPGTYCIEFVSSTLPVGSQFTDANQGGDDAADSDADTEGKTEAFTIEAGQDDDLTFDAGIIDPLNIGDTVFNDIDRDGIQDADEPGVPGVTVNLISAGPDGLFHTDDDVIVDTEETDANGNYLFEEVAPGTYCIEFVESTIPADYDFTMTDQGGDDALDSDADAEGKTGSFTLVAGQDDDLTFDAGIYTCTEITVEEPFLEDFTIECSENMPLPGVPNFVDAIDTSLDVILNETSVMEGCNEIITRTWTATNDCENTATYSQVITVVDTTDPVASDVPADMTIDCDDAIPSDEPSFTDNCDEDLVIDYGEANNALDCQEEIVRTWTATDDCGNATTVTQTITITDATAPTLEGVPSDMVVECATDVPAAAVPTANDNCDENAVVDFNETSETSGCIVTITRAWTVTDNCDNSTSYSQMITIEDTTSPVASNEPADVSISCTEGLPTDEPTFTDNCDSELTIVFNEDNAGNSCENGITRTWTATDDCGNSTTVTQVIMVNDEAAPTLNVPADAEVDCSTANTDPSNTGNGTAFDNCSGASVTYTDSPVQGSCPVTIIRTWTATDGCGNVATGDQQITIIDETAPVLNIPADVTVECDESTEMANTGFATATDACDDDVAITITDGPISGSCPYVFTRTFTATDFCGNVSTGEQVISIDDTTAPVLSQGPADATYDCDDAIPSATATFIDNCDDDVSVEMTEQNIAQSCGYQLVRLFVATDDCGNTAEYTQTITVTDSSAPVLVGVPNDMTLSCGMDPQDANVTAQDNCDPNVTVTMTEVENGQGCDASVTRTWTATDGCGNTTSESQTISFEDTTAPVINCPADVTVDCENSNSTPDITGTATATDNCSGASVTYSDGPLSGNCPAAFIRTWTAVDGCGNASTCEQSITIIDENGPTLIVPADITIACDASTDESNTGSASAFDACGGASVNYVDQSSGACPVVLTRTYTATDACGNTTVDSQIITIVDNSAPVISNGPSDITIQCDGGIPAAGPVSFFDNCDDDVTVEMADVMTDLNCGFQVVRTWTATDNCGNVGTYSQTISVTDNVAPVFNNVPADATIACGGNPPAPASVTASDNCDDNPMVTFNEETTGSGCSVLIVRTWTAIDECGNEATATQEISITDDVAPVLIGIPADMEADCSNVPEPALVTATDNCDADVSVTWYEETDFSTCPYTITRHYTAIDACGNLVKDNQVITVVDNTAPTFGNYPTSITASCDVLESYVLLATDACDNNVEMTYSDNNFSGGCLGVIERTWIATDNCNNVATAIQFITLYDDQAPEILDVPENITIDCGSAIPAAPELTAIDNCDSELDIEFSEVQNGTDCPYTITRTWTVIDDCDNETIETQIISVLTGGVVPDAEILTSPNPFAESTRISFILPEDGFVLLEVYSSIGEIVDVIFKGYALGGMYYEFNVDTDKWNNGMYHTKLIFEGEISSTKMMKSK